MFYARMIIRACELSRCHLHTGRTLRRNGAKGAITFPARNQRRLFALYDASHSIAQKNRLQDAPCRRFL
jgi:hypothetical protein